VFQDLKISQVNTAGFAADVVAAAAVGVAAAANADYAVKASLL